VEIGPLAQRTPKRTYGRNELITSRHSPAAGINGRLNILNIFTASCWVARNTELSQGFGNI
jgi:hypothetical protein